MLRREGGAYQLSSPEKGGGLIGRRGFISEGKP